MSTQMSLLDHVERPRRMVSHHTRGKIHGPAVEVAAEINRDERKARQQDAKVLAFFRSNPGEWGPSKVWLATGRTCPLTSTRRAMTNLANAGYLRCTPFRREGLYGRFEHLWTLNEGDIR